MRAVRTLRTGTVTAVVVWKLAALALLPAAFCCQAVLDADGVRPCCEGKDHGDFCPLKRAARSGATDGPRMQTCDSFDDALIGLLSLAGFTPESPAPPPAPDASGRLLPTGNLVTPLHHAPPSPPPRA